MTPMRSLRVPEHQRFRGGISRRQLLQVGGIGMLGLGLPELLRAGAPPRGRRSAGRSPASLSSSTAVPAISIAGTRSRLHRSRSVAPISRSPLRCRVCGSANCSPGWPGWRTAIVSSAR